MNNWKKSVAISLWWLGCIGAGLPVVQAQPQDTPSQELDPEEQELDPEEEGAAMSSICLDELVGQMNLAKAQIAPDPRADKGWKRRSPGARKKAMAEYESQQTTWKNSPDKPDILGKMVTWTLTSVQCTGSQKKGFYLRLISEQGNVALSGKLKMTTREYSLIKSGRRIEIAARIKSYKEPTSPAAGATVQLQYARITDCYPMVSQLEKVKGPTARLWGVRIPARNVIYLVSTRGSLTEVFSGVANHVLRSAQSLWVSQRYQILCFAERINRMRIGYTPATPANRVVAKKFMSRIVAEGQGGDGLERVLSSVAKYRTRETAIILVSTGQADNPKAVLAQAKRMRVPVYVFDLNAGESADSTLLLNIAELTNGKYVPMMKMKE